MARKSLSKYDEKLLSGIDSKVLSDLTVIEERGLSSLVKIINIILNEDKEWFFSTHVEESEIVKRHFALRDKLLFANKIVAYIQNAQLELNKRTKKD